MKFSTALRQRALQAGFVLVIGMFSRVSAQDGPVFSGAGWLEDNFIGNSSSYDYYNGKSVLSTGVQLSLNSKVSDKLRVVAGLGVSTGNTLPQTPGNQQNYSIPITSPYVSEADFTYTFKDAGDSKVYLKGGLFPYSYNPDSKDLGQYLFRGPVHPGLLISGYQNEGMLLVGNRASLPTASIMGLQLHHEWGRYQGDLILSTETQFYPFFDLSPAYVANYQVHSSFRIGAGVNLYHFIPIDPVLTNRDPLTTLTDYSDTAGGKPPTVTHYPYSGTKLMANATFDPKPLMAPNSMLGPEDLKVYAEVAVVGLESDTVYTKYYGDFIHRMPMMVGFNLPAFNYLDHLSLEVEWYGAPFPDDASGYTLTKFNSIPPLGNVKRDNWKWAVHASKTIQKHVVVTLQVANDHYRPGIYAGTGDLTPPFMTPVLTTPKDWYLTAKLAYFF